MDGFHCDQMSSKQNPGDLYPGKLMAGTPSQLSGYIRRISAKLKPENCREALATPRSSQYWCSPNLFFN